MSLQHFAATVLGVMVARFVGDVVVWFYRQYKN